MEPKFFPHSMWLRKAMAIADQTQVNQDCIAGLCWILDCSRLLNVIHGTVPVMSRAALAQQRRFCMFDTGDMAATSHQALAQRGRPGFHGTVVATMLTGDNISHGNDSLPATRDIQKKQNHQGAILVNPPAATPVHCSEF